MKDKPTPFRVYVTWGSFVVVPPRGNPLQLYGLESVVSSFTRYDSDSKQFLSVCPCFFTVGRGQTPDEALEGLLRVTTALFSEIYVRDSSSGLDGFFKKRVHDGSALAFVITDNATVLAMRQLWQYTVKQLVPLLADVPVSILSGVFAILKSNVHAEGGDLKGVLRAPDPISELPGQVTPLYFALAA